MEEQNKVPQMLEFLFGEAAGAVWQGASPRLLLWCRAFDDWLGERQQRFSKGEHKHAVAAWKRLLRQRRVMPWELSRADIEAHVAWMQAQGYAAFTTIKMVGIVSNFYAWCGERRMDPQCEAGFNPAAGVTRPKTLPTGREKLLSRGEVQALLGILQRDSTPLGRREYAFFLARLNLGAPLKTLQHLQWGQIRPVVEESSSLVVGSEGIPPATAGGGSGGAWLQWRPDGKRVHLAGEVWEAILAYLQASGRLAGMQAGKYIFVPLAEPGREGTGGAAEDWVERRCLSSRQIRNNLKLYGGLAGIPLEKLTLRALQRTAVRLRLDEAAAAGDGDAASMEAMHAFLDSQEKPSLDKRRLSMVPELPQDEGCAEPVAGEPPLPDRQAKPFKAIHGLYARSQPLQAVLEVLAEQIQGADEEFAGMRMLGRGLLARMDAAGDRESSRLGEVYFKVAYRVGEFVKNTRPPAGRAAVDSLADEVLAMLDEVALESGLPPVSQAAREAALGGEHGLEVTALRIPEEIASARYVLRNTFRLAQKAQEDDEYMRLVNVYSKGFFQLMDLLKIEQRDHDQLDAYVKEQIDQAIWAVTEELGLKG